MGNYEYISFYKILRFITQKKKFLDEDEEILTQALWNWNSMKNMDPPEYILFYKFFRFFNQKHKMWILR